MMPDIRDFSGDPFKRGAQVEVNFDDEGFRGSWYTATVLRRVSTKSHKVKPSRLHLQFHTLTAAGRGGVNEPLREAVDVILARPIPPREPRRRFRVGEDVDAFHNDGWWEGVVISVLDGGDRCSVFFRSSREQLVFSAADLRLHREWVHGKWVPPLEDDAQLPQPNETY